MYSSPLLPHIFTPTCTTRTATIIDNIFTKNYNPFVSGNLANTLSDHHAQFLIMGNQHSSLEFHSTEQMFCDFQEIAKKEKNRVTELHLSRNGVSLSSELFLKKVKKLINFWAPLQTASNKQKNLLNKPRLTSSILKSIEIKNKLHKRMCCGKDPLHKE